MTQPTHDQSSGQYIPSSGRIQQFSGLSQHDDATRDFAIFLSTSAFRRLLPILKTDLSIGRNRGGSVLKTENETGNGGGPSHSAEPPHILIVDDNQATARALALLLEKRQYRTSVSFRGSEALDQLNRNQFQGAVVDIHLPDISGLVVSQKLRERLGPQAPIIVLSGDTSMETLNSLPHVGATYFFSKPVNSLQLLERLVEWLPSGVNGK
jgi:CheY-like chemotaxis protein